PGNAPLLREVYVNWPPPIYPQDGRPQYSSSTATPAPAPPRHDAVFVLDETTADLGPLTGVEGGDSLEFATQREVALGAVTGTLYYLAPKGGMPPTPTPVTPTPPTPTPTNPPHFSTLTKSPPAALAATEPSPVTVTSTPTPTIFTVPTDSYFALVLLWHVGLVTLRLITASVVPYWTLSLNVRTSDDPASAAIRVGPQGYALYPLRLGVADLLGMATSMQPYTGCGR
ncbi:MAG TPA: hypothetical protein VGR57_10350, partial [Ktedonobacterales bacterium]|nr:hypothetical protein [Ktedonobacterales bacterium]